MHLPILIATAMAMGLPVFAPESSPKAPPYVGFDRNEYPGDAALPALHKQFAFIGYWLNNPPGATHNPWQGKRDILLKNGFGFLVAFNGRLEKEILRAKKLGKPPAALGKQDAAAAAAAAQREHFPQHTILFLDQEEGGRLTPEQAAYLLAWTEAVATTGYLPGVYASGKPVDDGPGPNGKPATITTIQDIRAQVATGHLHEIAFWVYQDACPPAPGCVVAAPPPDLSGTLNSTAWQYAQSPRERSITQACGKTYSASGDCQVPGPTHLAVDLSSSNSPDPSHGR
jgi:hypothetical protein